MKEFPSRLNLMWQVLLGPGVESKPVAEIACLSDLATSFIIHHFLRFDAEPRTPLSRSDLLPSRAR